MASNNTHHKTNTQNANDALSVSDILMLCLSKWRWFLLSITVCLGIAVIHILRSQPTYTRSSSILVKEDAKGNSSFSSELNSFADMGVFSSNMNVHNELRSIQSISVITEVINRLHLEMNYEVDGRFHKVTLYGSNLPVVAQVSGLADNDFCSWEMRLGKQGAVHITNLIYNGRDVSGGKAYKGKLNESISTPIGQIVVTPNSYYTGSHPYKKLIHVSRTGIISCRNSCMAKLSVALDDKLTTIINLSYKDHSQQRAEDFLSTLVAVYNENWVKSKNQIAVSTSRFIDERLAIIEQELGSVDNDISSFKSEHQIPSVSEAASMYMNNANNANARITELNNYLYMARYIRSYVSNDANSFQLLPTNVGSENQTLAQQISAYNEKLLQRNRLVANSSTKNPLVMDMDKSLSSMRANIVASIDNQINSLTKQISTFKGEQMQNTSLIAANPVQAKYLLSVERQQKVKEALYLFLLQKREENELSQAFSAYNTQIINPPHGQLSPTSPEKMKILAIALLIGLLLPAAIIFLKESTNTKLRGRKDLENTTVPFVGEIPLHAPQHRRLRKAKTDDSLKILVSKGNRDVINEAFRVMRTNLEFMSGQDTTSNVIVTTSFNPGSGKSFITSNIAISLAISNKRVLVIDGDLRHATISKLVNSPSKGLSDYLNGSISDINEVIVSKEDCEGLCVLPVGTIPPNPTELLMNPRLKTVIDEVKTQYDYVLIDCPPIEIVADTQIIEQHANRTIFVIRAGMLERSMLTDLENIYTEKKFKNMCLILNGTVNTGMRYGYKYGYKYGYHYGYHSYYGSQQPSKNRKN